MLPLTLPDMLARESEPRVELRVEPRVELALEEREESERRVRVPLSLDALDLVS